jgi:hypothetical protein
VTLNYAAPQVDLKKARPTRTSALLRDFASSITSERISIGEIVAALGDRGLGVLIAIFALPNILPSTVPFGNVLTGIPPLIFAFHLALGLDRLMLPRFIARQSMKSSSLKALVPRVAGVLSWFERLLEPRFPRVTAVQSERLIGIISIILALVSTLPIPFGHNLPALGLVLIGLGLIERDGLAILFGSAIGLIGTVLLGLVLFGLATGLRFIIHAHGVHL